MPEGVSTYGARARQQGEALDLFTQSLGILSQQSELKKIKNQESMNKLKETIYTGISKGDIEPTKEDGEGVFVVPGMEKLGKFKISKGTQTSQLYNAEKFKAYQKMQELGAEGLNDAEKVILGIYPKTSEMKITGTDIKEAEPKDVLGKTLTFLGLGQAPKIKALQEKMLEQRLGNVKNKENQSIPDYNPKTQKLQRNKITGEYRIVPR